MVTAWRKPAWWWTLWLLLWSLHSVWAQGVPRAECFPIENLPAPLQVEAEKVLLQMLDREGLYTVIGGIKPMSSAFVIHSFTVEPFDQQGWERLKQLRTILQTFRCGDELYADMMVFARAENGKKIAHAIVVNTRRLRETVRQYADFFARLGVTDNSHPMEVVMAVEYAPRSDRYRGYGYLFGYPKYAVDFFVAAAEEQERTGQFVERDFLSIPTFARETNLFVYAVPKGHQENEEDRQIRERALRVLSSYRARRQRYIGKDRPGIVELLRDWLDDGTGRCSLNNARFGASIPLFRSNSSAR
jgi:hypothetical protein